MMTEVSLRRRHWLWIALIVSVMVWITLPVKDEPLLSFGSISVFADDLILAVGLVVGIGDLLRVAGESEPSVARLLCRILVAYLLYEAFVVFPIGLWLAKVGPASIVRAMSTRFFWAFFPLLVTLFRDPERRRAASTVALAAGGVLLLWGVYLAITGGGGFYTEVGEGVRYRIFGATAPPLLFWPLAVAAAGVLTAPASAGLAGMALLGQTLTGFRSGLIALGLAGVSGLTTSKRLHKAVLWTLPVLALGAIVFLLFNAQITAMYSYVLSHLLDFQSTNALDRFERWGLAWDYFRAHPFNDYAWSWRRYLVTLELGYEPHNFILEIATTEGIAGLAFYGTLLVLAVRAFWKRIWTDGEVRAIACFLIAYVFFCTLNATWYAYSSLPLFIAALAALATRVDELDLSESHPFGKHHVSAPG